ncbi:Phosphotyrosyl phosphatase activator PTPA [Penicillium alfredii]|uniref:Serine/threonine-protein phosphatase 2A activator n=1 Tax=Penicillium alfredii TaxID=1506179 RepID=A0A9W9FS49_9EURO|nr:Phosphotyrosyl phosphatase activator PTPA [Penicillium alfredii]KAJ5105368.1 Phosphotyrosyl phosphatase activator PTPA [Penicillium alfredii]
MTTQSNTVRILPTMDLPVGHRFVEPSKKINESHDVSAFLTSRAYTDIMTFLLQLNRSMFPTKLPDGSTQTWPLNTDAVQFSTPVRQLQQLLAKLEDMMKEAPPDTGPRRFGNISFRRWYEIVEDRVSDLLKETLSTEVLQARTADAEGLTAEAELKAYFLGSWGSAQRLDYGTGHELSFLAFLGALWKLNGFSKSEPGVEERAIVLGVIQPYLNLVRSLIKTYTLEPAGSHGVWGLDDHSFVPYIFGSAQFSPAINDTDLTPEEGSLPDAPDPGGVVKANIVERERETNLYFSAIGFINDVKKGPFWEHSPMLYDISGIRAGWGKINKGMLKMYNAEVLSKFPVVQHFPFGSLFSWEQDPSAIRPPATAHTKSGPQARPVAPESGPASATPRPVPGAGTKAPWTSAGPETRAAPPMGPTAAPWAATRREGPPTSTLGGPARTPTGISRPQPGPLGSTKAPRASATAPAGSTGDLHTNAPWTKPG